MRSLIFKSATDCSNLCYTLDMSYLENNNTSFKAKIYWVSANSRKFAKDFPEFKNILKHHMGGENVTHYVQYDKDVFVLSSAKVFNDGSQNSYCTGYVGCSIDDIKNIFTEHSSKYMSHIGIGKNDFLTTKSGIINKKRSPKHSSLGTLFSFLKKLFCIQCANY